MLFTIKYNTRKFKKLFYSCIYFTYIITLAHFFSIFNQLSALFFAWKLGVFNKYFIIFPPKFVYKNKPNTNCNQGYI